MATGAAIASGVTGLVQLGVGLSQEAKRRKAIRDFKRQDLTNPFKELTVSTLQSDQLTEANNVNFATSVDALQRGDSRTLLGGLPALNDSTLRLQQAISADLDQQDKRNKLLIARGEESIRAIKENRDNQNLLGLGQDLQNARQTVQSGLSNLLGTALSLGGLNNDSETVLTDSGAFKDTFKVKIAPSPFS